MYDCHIVMTVCSSVKYKRARWPSWPQRVYFFKGHAAKLEGHAAICRGGRGKDRGLPMMFWSPSEGHGHKVPFDMSNRHTQGSCR